MHTAAEFSILGAIVGAVLLLLGIAALLAGMRHLAIPRKKVPAMDAELLAGTFADLSDTMVADPDITDFLNLLTDRSAELLSASAAGVVLTGPQGELRPVAYSSEAASVLEQFQIQHEQGPCPDCLRTGQAVTVSDTRGPDQRWPQFADAAANAGFRAVHALPMRLQDEVIGALSLFMAAPGRLDEAKLRVGQALAALATIALVQERSLRRSEVAAGQLESALSNRVIIDQATGKLAERLSIDIDRAFRMLRDYARNSDQQLSDVARNFVDSASADFPPVPRQSNLG